MQNIHIIDELNCSIRSKLPTKGLSPLSANSVKAYTNVWKKFIVMLLIQFVDAGDIEGVNFSMNDAINFSKIVLTANETEFLATFVEFIKQQHDTDEDGSYIELAQPEFHALFIKLIQRKSAPGNYPFKSPFSVFCAFSQN